MSISTDLHAVNSMLATVGEAPIASLDTPLTQAQLALNTLQRVCREVQAGPWTFNNEDGITLSLNELGELTLPTTYPVIDIDASNTGDDVVLRGTRLYDRKNHTFTFTAPLKVDVRWALPYGDLPEPARQYVYIKAARQFVKNFYQDDGLNAMTKEDEAAAYINLVQYDNYNADANFLDAPEVSSIFSR